MRSKGRRKQSKGSSPSKPKEFHLTQGEVSEWESILADLGEVQAQALEFQAKEAGHNAWRTRFWTRVCRRLGIRTQDVDTTKAVHETIYLRVEPAPANPAAPGAEQNPQHKPDEGTAK